MSSPENDNSKVRASSKELDFEENGLAKSPERDLFELEEKNLENQNF